MGAQTMKYRKIIHIFFISLIISVINSKDLIFKNKKDATESFFRTKRANGLDEFRGHQIERECNEELCSKREFLDIQEKMGRNLKQRLASTDDDKRNRFNSYFEVYYTECHDRVIAAGLDDRNGLDFRKHCIDSFLEPRLEELSLFF